MLQIEQKNESHGTVVLYLKGKITIESAEEFKQALLSALEQNTCLMIEGSGVEEIDIFGLQLFCSACRTSISDNKLVTWKNGIPQLMKEVSDKTGFARSHVCNFCPEDAECLWLAE